MKWRLLTYRTFSAFENMAIDEAIFRETAAKQKKPTLRFFGWSPPAVSIGYFQDLKEINVERCRAAGVDIVRRMTGGKAVYHRHEVTYSLTAPGSEKIFPDDIIRSYELISRGLARGLSILGIGADPAADDCGGLPKKSPLSSACFFVPSARELLVGGKKICGSAQVRTRGGFLQHGSMLMVFDAPETVSLTLPSCSATVCSRLKNSVTAVNELSAHAVSEQHLSLALQKGISEELDIEFSEGRLTASEKLLAHELVQKYASDAWNCQRRKEAFKAV